MKNTYYVQDGYLCSEVFYGVYGPSGTQLYLIAKEHIPERAKSSWIELFLLWHDFESRLYHAKKAFDVDVRERLS